MDTIQRVYLKHKLNPRKFDGMTLFRVTTPMGKREISETARKLRKTGRVIRIDSFQGKYAVWASLRKKRVPVPKGRLGLDDSATKYLNSLLPEFWYVVVGNKKTQHVETGYFVGVNIITHRDSVIYLEIYEHTKFLEVYSISSVVKGKGDGTIVMKALKRYVDAKHKGIILRYVKNYQFVERFRYYRQMPKDYEQYDFPDYYYRVSPNTKLRHLWT